jgi:hypothetical protein
MNAETFVTAMHNLASYVPTIGAFGLGALLGAIGLIAGAALHDKYRRPKCLKVGNTEIAGCPLVVRDKLKEFLEILHDAIYHSPVPSLGPKSRRYTYKLLTTFSVRIYDQHEVIRRELHPTGLVWSSPALDGKLKRVGSAVSVVYPFFGAPHVTIHAVAFRSRVPREAILHALTEHVWPAMVPAIAEAEFEIRDEIARLIDDITEMRSEIYNTDPICGACIGHGRL